MNTHTCLTVREGDKTMHYFIKAKSFLFPDREEKEGFLEVKDGFFRSFTKDKPKESKVIDYSKYTIAPGLFDTHIHGLAGKEVMDGSITSIQRISTELLRRGVTRFLPTTLTASRKGLDKAIQSTAEAMNTGLPGAVAEGIFLEGPYFTAAHKGAQDEKHFKKPSNEDLDRWLEIAGGKIVKIALAPELIGAFDFIEYASKKGVVVSIGHTNADHSCCKKAIQLGANIFIHLFNGMLSFHHREPGAVGTALMDDDSYAELICDGHHAHPTAATLAYKLKKDKLILISDCMRAGGMADGKYKLGKTTTIVKNGIARTELGSLAGSTLNVLDGIKNLASWSGQPLYRIWHLASRSAAKSIGKDRLIGDLSEGKYADFVLLDQNTQIQATAIEGKVKYTKTAGYTLWLEEEIGVGYVSNTKDMLIKARKEGYAVPAFNIHNLETVKTVVEAASELKSPVILAATPGTMNYSGRAYIQSMAEVAAKENDIPIALHLDHHEDIESIKESLDLGVKSVMIDGSHHDFNKNVEISQSVVETAHKYGATVEVELGKLVGQEDDLIVEDKDAEYTDPEAAVEFVERTGADSLAVAIGTGHGLYETEPNLDFERLQEISERVPIPIVLHGASGLTKEDVQKCIALGCAKVNISTELKIPFSTALRNYMIENPDETDPRKYMSQAKNEMKKVVEEKIRMCMSDGKA